MQNANYGPYRWQERNREHHKQDWAQGEGPQHPHQHPGHGPHFRHHGFGHHGPKGFNHRGGFGHHGRMGFHHRGGWGHHRGGFFPILPLLFLGFLFLGGWKLIFPLIVLAMLGGMFFYMKRHHGGWGQENWRKWAEENRWRWDDDSEKPKRKTDEFVTLKRKNDDDTLYV